MKYEHKSIEKKWQDKWEDAGVFHATNDYSKPKFYALVEFPYPSGAGLHVGHPRSYTALDIVARKRRMQGYNVLYPMGWDAFGLPAENYAIKNHVHPEKFTRDNIQNFKHQLQSLGLSFDWSREVATIDPGYYKWTQWIFQQLFKKGLAYKASMPVNWCTSCKCVLANEEVVNGVCERCGSPVVRKEKSQWMLAITKYAQRLIDDLDEVNFIDRVKTQQTNWIGRSEGAEVDFTATTGETLTVFTTRADTLFGVTYMVMSPEHPYLKQWKDKISNWDEVVAYQQAAARKSDFERTEMAKDKTGVKLEGVAAINPVNKKEIPIFVSDYVLMGYGTGAIMAVPGHDDRDWEFAKKFGLDIIEVVSGGDVTKAAFTSKDENAIMVNSDFLNGKTVKEAIPYMKDWVEAQGFGRKKVNFKLRDWVFSRQRYWGEPIPLVYCEKCGWVPVPEEELPLKLPEVQSYEPTDNGESPLAKCTDWINTTCPCCGAPAKRETDTMPQWAGSSWYFLRYMDPNNDQALVGKEAIKYWNQVDWYNGGMEHTTLHLLYSRFWHKFLYDIGVVPTSEPYAKRTSHGMILGLNPRCYDNMSDEDKAKLLAEHGDEAGARKYLFEQYGEMTEHPIVKMSKSLNNVVNPDDIVEEYGADTMRLYEMFLGDFEKAAPWDPKAIKGCRRFLDRIWNLAENLKEGDELSHTNEAALHKTLKKVGDDAENLKANTAIAAMMGLLNQLEKNGCNKAEFKMFITMLNPFAPHMTEELNEQLYGGKMLAQTEWPVYDESKTVDATVEIAVQINGKVRSVITIAADADEKAIEEQALADSKIQAAMAGMQVVKAIVIKKKIVNFVVKPL